MRFYNERVEASRNFANKVWNRLPFHSDDMKDDTIEEPEDSLLKPADRWILSRVNTLAKDVTENMDKYELGIAVQKVYDFIWDEFCDWYVELAKIPDLPCGGRSEKLQTVPLWTLRTVLAQALKLLHSVLCRLLRKKSTARWCRKKSL